MNEVLLEDVKVPVENLVGEEGQRLDLRQVPAGHERTGIAGVSRSKRELAFLKHIATEQAGGRPPDRQRAIPRQDLRAWRST